MFFYSVKGRLVIFFHFKLLIVNLQVEDVKMTGGFIFFKTE